MTFNWKYHLKVACENEIEDMKWVASCIAIFPPIVILLIFCIMAIPIELLSRYRNYCKLHNIMNNRSNEIASQHVILAAEAA